MNTYDLKGLLAEVWATPGVSTITYAVLLNLVLAWAVAVKNKTFTLQRVADFATQQLIPYVSVYVGAQFLGEGAGYGWLGNAAYLLVLAKMGASIVEHLNDLGVPIPASIMQYIAPRLKAEWVDTVKPFAPSVDVKVTADAIQAIDSFQAAKPFSTTTTTVWQPSEGPYEVRPTSWDGGAKG